MKFRILLALLAFVAFPSLTLAQDFICSPGQVKVVATGDVIRTGSRGELDYAIEHSDTTGSIIECNGHLPGVSLAIGENYRDREVVRKDPIRVTLVPGPDHVSIGPISWGGKKLEGGLPGFAVEHLELKGVTVDGRFAQSPLQGYLGTLYGDIIFDEMTLLSEASKTKWGTRQQGHARSITIVNCVAMGGGIEHFAYVDNPTGDDSYVTFSGNQAKDWMRTMFQLVTREYSSLGFKNPGAAQGDLTIERNTAIDCGQHGAWNFTVTGWPNGTVLFKENTGESKWGTGLFICYYNSQMGEELLNENGYQVGKVVWVDNTCRYNWNASYQREANGFGNIEELILRVGQVEASVLTSPRSIFELAWDGRANGSNVIESRMSPWDTWNTQASEYSGDWRTNGVKMDQAQVDGLWDQAVEVEIVE